MLRSRIFGLTVASVALVSLLGCTLSEPATESNGLAGSGGLMRAISVQTLNAKKLFAVSGVVGTGSSLNNNGEPVVVVFTATEDVQLPEELDGVQVVKEVTGVITTNPGLAKAAAPVKTPVKTSNVVVPTCQTGASWSRFARPVPIGVSTSHTSVTAGTIGVRVKDLKGNLLLLSNNHVFANTNNAAIGDKILQPGTVDGGKNPADVIGTLSSFTVLQYCKGATCPANRMDAALVSTTAALSDNKTPCDGYGTPAIAYATPTANLKVKKYGRTTGLTSGVIAAVNVTVDVAYTATNIARFTGQVYIATPNFIGPGDSGSLIVTETGNKPVALIFAGTSNATFATPIAEILAKHAITIDGI